MDSGFFLSAYLGGFVFNKILKQVVATTLILVISKEIRAWAKK